MNMQPLKTYIFAASIRIQNSGTRWLERSRPTPRKLDDASHGPDAAREENRKKLD